MRDSGPQGSQLQETPRAPWRVPAGWRCTRGFGDHHQTAAQPPDSMGTRGGRGVATCSLMGQFDDVTHSVAVCEPPARSSQCGHRGWARPTPGPSDAEGSPLGRPLDGAQTQRQAPRSSAIGADPGGERARGGPGRSLTILDRPTPPSGVQLGHLVWTRPRSGRGRQALPLQGGRKPPAWLTSRPTGKPHQHRGKLNGDVFLNTHVLFVSPLTFGFEFLFSTILTPLFVHPRHLRPRSFREQSRGEVISQSQSLGKASWQQGQNRARLQNYSKGEENP